MIFGILSDTHDDKAVALPHVMKQFKERKVTHIIHCGDIEAQDLDPDRFLGLPVVCALNAEQIDKPAFRIPPPNWQFTVPGDRVRDIGHIRCYIGHKRSYEILTGSEIQFARTLDEFRRQHDGLRLAFSGHSHRQVLFNTNNLVTFINPGAVTDSLDGHEFATINTDNDEIVFGRIPRTTPIERSFSVGIISDSLKISLMDVNFWKKLADEFKRRDVSQIIHCGNIAEEDIGRKELAGFTVHYYLRENQHRPNTPLNWHHICHDEPIVDIGGYQFYIQLDLARKLLDESEIGMHKHVLSLREKYPFVNFLLYGCTHNAFLEEQEIRIINPGDVIRGRCFAVVCLPRAEITFGQVPTDPLPPL